MARLRLELLLPRLMPPKALLSCCSCVGEVTNRLCNPTNCCCWPDWDQASDTDRLMFPFPAAVADNAGVIPVFIADIELYGLFALGTPPTPILVPPMPMLLIVAAPPTPLEPAPRESAELLALSPISELGAPVELALLPVEYVEAPVTTGDRLACVVGMLKLRGVTPKLILPTAEPRVGNVPDAVMPGLNALLPSWLTAVVLL